MNQCTTNKIHSKDCYPIRKKVLRPHQTVNQVTFEQDDHAHSFHLGAFDKFNLIGVTSIIYDGTDTFRLRGMAILQEYQRQGLGKLLLKKAIDLTPNNALLWCNARTHALEFYKSFGFEEVGSSFEVEHIGPHIRMQLEL
ncbi:MAG: GNAT family N-acetyltransferase [Candidatus Cloacimonetes bacterium]|nr:GNAT family N-acetyltransferase [Candidatus Cloacimonadota bacterium]